MKLAKSDASGCPDEGKEVDSLDARRNREGRDCEGLRSPCWDQLPVVMLSLYTGTVFELFKEESMGFVCKACRHLKVD